MKACPRCGASWPDTLYGDKFGHVTGCSFCTDDPGAECFEPWELPEEGEDDGQDLCGPEAF